MSNTIDPGTAIIGAQYNATPPTLNDKNYANLQCDPSGFIKVNVAAGGSSGGQKARTTATGNTTANALTTIFTAGTVANGYQVANNGTSTMWLGDGTTDPASGVGIPIQPNGYYEVPASAAAPTAAVRVWCTSVSAYFGQRW